MTTGDKSAYEIAAGTYTGDFVVTRFGSDNTRLVFNAQEGVVIDGSLNIAGWYVSISGLRITDSSNTDRESVQSTSSPTDITGRNAALTITGSHVKVADCHLTNAKQGLSCGVGSVDVEFVGCLAYHNGWKNPANAYGHGVYPQNSDLNTRKVFRDCLFFDNFGMNVHIYGASGLLNNFTLEGCAAFNAGQLIGQWYGEMLYGGNEPFSNPIIRECMTYGATSALGYGSGNTVSHAIVKDNYFATQVGAPFRLVSCVPDEMTGNAFVGVVDVAWSHNAYPDNVYATPLPVSGCVAFVRKHPTTNGRGMIVVYNWDQADSVVVDVSAVLGTGATYKLRNVQDYFEDVATGNVAGDGTISIDMRAASHSVAAPVGWTPAPIVFPVFGCFIVETV